MRHSVLSPDWNNPKAPNKFRKNIENFWSADRVANFEKFLNREVYQNVMMVVIQRYLPEIKKGGYSILDMSCGSGMFLELSRSFGNKILGTNEPIPCVYAPLLKSQKVPYSLVDGSILPYPFEDNSFDIVTLMNALWFFEEKLWVDIIAELLRISSKTVFIISSLQDKYIDGNKKVAEMVSPPGWVRTIDIGNYIKWEYNGG